MASQYYEKRKIFPFNRWEMHEKISKPLRKTAKCIKAWWEFTGKPEPSEDEIMNSLQRLVTGVLTHPVTIGQSNFHLL